MWVSTFSGFRKDFQPFPPFPYFLIAHAAVSLRSRRSDSLHGAPSAGRAESKQEMHLQIHFLFVGESRWESNPPKQAAAYTGFEDQRAHQSPFYSHIYCLPFLIPIILSPPYKVKFGFPACPAAMPDPSHRFFALQLKRRCHTAVWASPLSVSVIALSL